MYDKVTVVFEQEPETRQPLHAGFVDTTMRENVSVDVALALLEQFAHGQIRPALAEISVAPQNRHVLVDIRDGWFSAAGFRRAITKINHLTVGENPPVVLRVRVIEHFPLEIGAPFISELERRVSAHGSLRICCNSDGWHAFRALVSSVVPLQNVLRFDTIDQATQDLDRHE
ncbi:MAG: hypothetical protein EA426_00055 [Spirochaetaceae bacterium]|nr:MAG: hypothetical protein EA426_00055 [Spirochaetaceae bacterium]